MTSHDESSNAKITAQSANTFTRTLGDPASRTANRSASRHVNSRTLIGATGISGGSRQ